MRYRTFSLHINTVCLKVLAAAFGCVAAAGAQTPGQHSQAQLPRAAVGGPAPNFRPDPMKPWWNTNPRPPAVLTMLDPIRFAARGSGELRADGAAETHVDSHRRVSGIAISGGVLAVLDGRLGVEIVRPGQVLDDGFRVEAIGADSVTLTRAHGNQSIVERIRLTDAAPAR